MRVALRDRLRQHATSIDQAENLELGDFHYRCLVVDDIWIPLGENMMIE
ncbi:MAG: Eco29kI family restriction endonuclease, partial [Candidatus Competibacteraceae bacterium]|nr:Eco29kI family restriction endonuclease [Candidatus Competibacteraceae bacterium]